MAETIVIIRGKDSGMPDGLIPLPAMMGRRGTFHATGTSSADYSVRFCPDC